MAESTKDQAGELDPAVERMLDDQMEILDAYAQAAGAAPFTPILEAVRTRAAQEVSRPDQSTS